MRKPGLFLLLLTLGFVVTVGVAVGIGTSSIDLTAVWSSDQVVLAIRWPRVILAALVGAALATAGTAFQAILRNPLADPYVVGVSGGAALGGVLALVLGWVGPWTLPLASFSGAILSALVLFGFAKMRGYTDPLTLLLLGVVFNSFASAVVTFLKTVVSATKAQEILFWLMGVIEVVSPATLWILAIYIALGCVVLILGMGALNLLATSDDEARALGLPVEKARWILFSAASLLVGAVVAVSGLIGFVGLVVPHVMRRLVSADHRWLLPASLIGGAIFLVIADALARMVFYFFGTEIPVGVITAFTGGPFFLVLLLNRKK